MSADNWGKCPKCIKEADAEQASLKSKADSSYGKVTQGEWLALIDRVDNPPELEHTLREDYECWIDSSGKFFIHYRAHCRECGFKHNFKKDEMLV